MVTRKRCRTRFTLQFCRVRCPRTPPFPMAPFVRLKEQAPAVYDLLPLLARPGAEQLSQTLSRKAFDRSVNLQSHTSVLFGNEMETSVLRPILKISQVIPRRTPKSALAFNRIGAGLEATAGEHVSLIWAKSCEKIVMCSTMVGCARLLYSYDPQRRSGTEKEKPNRQKKWFGLRYWLPSSHRMGRFGTPRR